MFCQNCGKKLADNAKFCSFCGQPVLEDEESGAAQVTGAEAAGEPEETDGAPSEPAGTSEEPAGTSEETTGAPETTSEGAETVAAAAAVGTAASREITQVAEQPILTGKKHRGKALILLGAAVLVVIALVFGAVKLLSSLGGSAVYVYATDDNELCFLKNLKEGTEAEELTDEWNDSVKFSPDKKYIYFFEQDPDEYSDVADLYRVKVSDIGKDDGEPERVSANVYRYNWYVLKNGGAVYRKGSGDDADLYCYDGEDSFRLARDVYTFSLDEKETYAYYTELDQEDYTETLFRIALKEGSNAEELLDGFDALYTDYDADILVYGEIAGTDEDGWMDYYDIYSIKPGESAKRLVRNACNVYGVESEGGKVTFAYLTQETEEHTLYDFVTDSMAASDANAKEPVYDDYVAGYNSWGWATYDWDAYYDAWDVWSAVRDRNYIREDLKETSYDLVTYTLHRFDGETDTVLASGMSAYPTCSAEDNIYLYRKSGQKVTTVADVADLYYASDIYDYMDTAEETWYVNVNGTESELDLDDWDGVHTLIYVSDSEVILHAYDDDGSALLRYTLGKSGLTFVDVLEDEFYSTSTVTVDGKKTLYYFVDVDRDYTYGDLVRYEGGEPEVIAKDASVVYLLEDGTVFKLEDMEYNEWQEGTLYTLVDGKEKRIADEVRTGSLLFLAKDQILYISENDLYVWENGESRRLARDVVNVWASETMVARSFYC